MLNLISQNLSDKGMLIQEHLPRSHYGCGYFLSVRQVFYSNKAAYKIGMVSTRFSLYFLAHNGKKSTVNKLGVVACALSSGN